VRRSVTQEARNPIRDRIVELRRVPAASLLPNPRNWRRHPERQRAAMAGVLSEIGYAGALLARETPDGLMLIDGHLRAETTPGQHVPVLVLDVSEAEADKLLATVDPLAALAETDGAALRQLLESVQSDDAGVRAMLDGLREQAAKAEGARGGNTDPDAVPETPAVAVSRTGDLWLLGEHRLLCGDSTSGEDVARLMGGERADCVFTSPPYAVGIDYGTYEDTIDNLRRMLPVLASRWCSVVRDGGFAVVNFGDIAAGRDVAKVAEPCEYPMALEYWPVFREAGWTLWSRRAWCKPNARVHSPWCIQSNRAATDWEHLWTWKRPGDAILSRVDGEWRSSQGWYDSSTMEGVAVGKERHGAGMATGIACWMLNVHSRPTMVVHEPFSGTGTTIIACEQLNRRCYAMEIEPRYVDVAVRRWQDFTGREATLEASGQTFAEVAAERLG
jgi:DNA modification methylase